MRAARQLQIMLTNWNEHEEGSMMYNIYVQTGSITFLTDIFYDVLSWRRVFSCSSGHCSAHDWVLKWWCRIMNYYDMAALLWDISRANRIGHGLMLVGGFSLIFPSQVGLAIPMWLSRVKWVPILSQKRAAWEWWRSFLSFHCGFFSSRLRVKEDGSSMIGRQRTRAASKESRDIEATTGYVMTPTQL